MRTTNKVKVLKKAFIDTLPILVAFIILGIGFGVLMSDAGYPLFFVFLMSAFIYAGSMQFVAVSWRQSDALTAYDDVSRYQTHLLVVIIGRYKDTEKKTILFGLTDETYSLVCSKPHATDDNRTAYYYCTLLNHLYWIAGGIIGNVRVT